MSKTRSARRILGPFNRVEGDLEVRVDVQADRIVSAHVNSPLFRGFEQILHGKDPRDALVYTPRICGICSVSQSVAAAQSLAAAQQLQAAPNGQLATNLILAAENMVDHLTHFYLFFMPDFARDVYAGKPWFSSVRQRFKAQSGRAAGEVLPARASFLHLTGILAGKWPHSLAIQPGGTTRPVEVQEKIRLATIIKTFRYFLQDVLFADELENISALKTEDALVAWKFEHQGSDFARFLKVAEALELNKLGRAYDNFMSYGAYRFNQTFLFTSGTWQQEYSPLNTDNIKEDVSHSWLNNGAQPKHPYQGSTLPDADEGQGYSWCKAPRLNQQVMEVGAIARQMVDGHALIHDLVARGGANVYSRVVARLLEMACVVPAMETWCETLQVKEPFCITDKLPDEAQGAGLIEAARGSLGHWLRIKKGRILNYQIIAPTTWNFSPRDADNQPGALERALQDTWVGDDEQASVAIQHIIRSFDPCMVCTVH